MYYGPVPLETSDFALFCQVSVAKVAAAADTNAVTFRIYGPSGNTALLTGTFGTTVIDNQTGFYRAASVALTSANGFAAGNTYTIRITYQVSSVPYVEIQTVTVV